MDLKNLISKDTIKEVSESSLAKKIKDINVDDVKDVINKIKPKK